MGSTWNSLRMTLRRLPPRSRSNSVFSPEALRRIEPISFGETATGTASFLAPYTTPGMSPCARRRRLTFLPFSDRFRADTTISAMTIEAPSLYEQARYRCLFMNVPDGLPHQLGDREGHDLGAALLLVRQGDGIRDDQPRQRAALDDLHRAARQHRVGARRQDLPRPRVLDRLGHLAERAPGVDDVVDDERGASLHLADDVVHLGHVRALPALVDDGEAGVQALRVGPGPLHAARVGGHDNQLGQLQ